MSKKWWIAGLVLLVFGGSLVAQNNNTLTVKIENIQLQQGEIFVTLTSDSTQFPGMQFDEKFFKRKKVEAKTMTITFQGLPDGNYAFAVFQDLNGNDNMDYKKFGIPAEPFAFSNNALRKFGPPHFKQAKFPVKGGKNQEHTVQMVYQKPKGNTGNKQ